MKYLPILGLISCMFFVKNVTAQEYYQIFDLAPSEVQNKMDENKINGIDILTGVKAHHIIGVTGVNISQKSELQTILEAEVKIIDFTINDDVTSIIVNADSKLKNVEIQNLISALNGVITGQTTTYFKEQ